MPFLADIRLVFQYALRYAYCIYIQDAKYKLVHYQTLVDNAALRFACVICTHSKTSLHTIVFEF
ncbi:hypothetical protein ANAPC1_00408 [Anaplasma phagocytophilum]|uniref:Uncharacterized protein n=1 Tax=Anaplasma phagocytophilum TaxID=948 RepID=A0AA45USF6_ANAPH|nr:hypothetical protein ANAPC1_00408 [Anaplasma phagocytophilum]